MVEHDAFTRVAPDSIPVFRIPDSVEHCIPYSVDHGRCAFRIPAIWVWCVLYSRFISGSCLYISKVDTKLGVFEPHCPTRHKVESIHIFSKTRCARMSVVSNSSHVAAHRLHTPSHELTRAHSATRTCMPPHRCAHTPHTHFPTPLASDQKEEARYRVLSFFMLHSCRSVGISIPINSAYKQNSSEQKKVSLPHERKLTQGAPPPPLTPPVDVRRHTLM